MNEITQSTVTEISTLHIEIEGDLKVCLDKAIRIGELLTTVKDELKHGEFLPWIADNMPFTDRTARAYMTLHNRKDELSDANNIAEAYRMIAPKTETVSDLDWKWDPDTWIEPMQDLYKKINAMQVGETITGFHIKNKIKEGNEPVLHVYRCGFDCVFYQWNTFVYDGVIVTGPSAPTPIEMLMFYLCEHPKYSMEVALWAYPGVDAHLFDRQLQSYKGHLEDC